MRKSEFLEKLRNNPRPVVVDFWAPWCAPCRAISPALDKLAAEFEGRVDLWKVNTDEEAALAAELHIFSIPTVAVYRRGEEALRRTGMQPEPALRKMFEVGLGEREARSVGALGLAERLLRLGAGLTVAAIGALAASSWLLVLLGALIAFSGVYDRCPLWQALSAQWRGGRA